MLFPLANQHLDYSPSPVIESRKKFWVQRKFLFHVLIWPYDFQKNFGANRKMVNQPQKSSIFKMVENHHGAHFHMWGQNSNAYELHIVGKKILSGLTSLKKWGPKRYMLQAIDRKPKGYIHKSCRFFVKNSQDTKKWLNNKITMYSII